MKIKGSYLYFTLLACAYVAVCAYVAADLFADLPSLVFLALLLAFACIGLWLKDALIGARYLFYCVCVQLLFAATIFATLKFPAMAQFVRSAEIGTGGTGIPLGIVLLVLPAFFCALPYYYRTGVKKIPQKFALSGILILNVAITLAYAFYFERLFYSAI
jgi:putative lipoprotein